MDLPFTDRLIKIAVKRSKRQSVAELRSGASSKIAGIVLDVGEPLLSPIQERPCFAYSVIGDSGHRRGNIVREQRCNPIAVQDHTGIAVVEPGANCVLALKMTYKIQLRFFERRTEPRVIEFFKRNGLNVGSRFRSIQEGTIEPGNLVVVYGSPTISRPEAPYRQSINASFSDGKTTFISDDISRYR